MRSSLLVVACALGIGSTAWGEFVYFAKGGQAHLTARVEGDQVGLDLPDGPRTFSRGDFLAIVPGPRPEVEWPGRLAGAKRIGTVEARFSAAWWALENGLTPEASSLLRELKGEAASHLPLQRALAGLEALDRPRTDPDLAPLLQRLRPGRFRTIRGPLVVLLYQGDEAEARERLDVLERVAQTFTLAFEAQGISLRVPNHRLVSVYFAEKRDYASFLRSVDSEAFVEAQGYYHPSLDAVFAYDTRSTDEDRASRRAIANRAREGAAPADLARQSLLLDLAWRSTDLGLAAHETVHALTIACGLAPRFDDFPPWLHEGLAAQFEVIRGGRWSGLGRTHDLRLPDWRAIHPAPRLAPLLRDPGFALGYRRDDYAASWSLVYFLRKAHPREFLAFLDLLRSPEPGRPDRSVDAFRAAFGPDLAGLETAWHRFLADLKTPIEAARPPQAGVRSSLDRQHLDPFLSDQFLAIPERFGYPGQSRSRPISPPSWSILMPTTQRIEVSEVEGVQVVSFQDRLLFDDRTVREVSDQLGAALPNDGKPIRLVLDFTGVDLISSSLLGKLILLQRRVDGTGGKLRLCELSPTVQSVFKTSNLDRLFGVVRDRRAALAEL